MPEMLDSNINDADQHAFAVDSFNETGLPIVQRVRMPWWRVVRHTIRIYLELKNVQLQTWLMDVLGVDRRLRALDVRMQVMQDAEQRTRIANDQSMIGLISRHASQVNHIAKLLPPLIAAKKRLEFYENTVETLRYAKEKYAKLNPPLKLEKSNGDQGTEGRRPSVSDRGGAGVGGEVSEGPRLDLAREDGQGGIQRPESDGALEGRGAVQVGDAAASSVAHPEHVYCHACSEAGGAGLPIHHKAPACPEPERTVESDIKEDR